MENHVLMMRDVPRRRKCRTPLLTPQAPSPSRGEGQLKSPIGFTRYSGFSPTLQDRQACGIVKRMATQTLTLKVPFLWLNAAKAAEFARLQGLNFGPQ